MKPLFAFLTIMVVSPMAVFSQEVKDFELVNVINGKSVSLRSFQNADGIILIFTSNGCPYDEYYRSRVARLAKTYGDRVPVVLINSHVDPRETRERMLAKANELKWTTPYLSDKDQTLSSQLAVKKSPEAFLIRRTSGKFIVVYRGAIDDNAQVEADVRNHYLRDAIDRMLSGKTIETPEVRPVGCNLRRKI